MISVYARFIRLFFLARYDIPFWSLRAQQNLVLCAKPPKSTIQEYKIPLDKKALALTMGRTPRRCQLTGNEPKEKAYEVNATRFSPSQLSPSKRSSPTQLSLRMQSNLRRPPPNVWRGGKEGLEGGGDSWNLPWLSRLCLGDSRCVRCWGGSCRKRDAATHTPATHTVLVASGFTLRTNYFVYSTIGM